MSGTGFWVHPMKLPSCANLREHWAVRAKRMRGHRTTGYFHTRKLVPLGDIGDGDRIRILIVRHGNRKLDSDNLASACKGLRDGIADALGIDDGSERIEWAYEQQTCKRGEERVTCQVSWVSASQPRIPVEPAPTSEVKAMSPAPTATKRTSGKRLRNGAVGR